MTTQTQPERIVRPGRRTAPSAPDAPPPAQRWAALAGVALGAGLLALTLDASALAGACTWHRRVPADSRRRITPHTPPCRLIEAVPPR